MLQIEEGLVYFRRQAAIARPKVDAMHDAIAAGDLEAARTAYVLARPEYEQIEVLAPGFGDTDCAIDCRACAPRCKSACWRASVSTPRACFCLATHLAAQTTRPSEHPARTACTV